MSGMINRVAQAIASKSVDEPTDKDHFDMARAAIAAMREPTEAMIDAGDDTNTNSRAVIWRAMIDAALSAGVSLPIAPLQRRDTK